MKALIAAVVVGLALAGVALAAATGEPKHDYRPADQALAKSIGLKLADLPKGFKATPSSPDSGTPHCKNFNPDQSDLTERGKADSPTFEGPGGLPSINSNVSVFLSTAQAQTAFNRVVRPALPGCLSSIIQSSATAGSKFLPVSAKLAPLSGFGQQSALVRLVLTIVQGKTHTPLVADFVLIRKGRVDALVGFVTVQQPYSGETALVTKLASRMP